MSDSNPEIKFVFVILEHGPYEMDGFYTDAIGAFWNEEEAKAEVERLDKNPPTKHKYGKGYYSYEKVELK